MKRNTKIIKKIFRLFIIIVILMFSVTALGKKSRIVLKDMGSFIFINLFLLFIDHLES